MIMKTISKTAAMKQAKNEITIYRNGAQWQVSEYDPRVNAHRVSSPMSFWIAREIRKDRISARAAELINESYAEATADSDAAEADRRDRIKYGD